jgi:carbamoyltransferase
MGTQLFEYHPVIGYHFIPNVKTRLEHEGGGYLVRVNNVGFRDEKDFQTPKTGKFRVLLFGDSFTAGDGVSNKYRFGDVLETLIPDVEVYNFGLPGTGTDQHYLTYREIASAYEHDLIIIGAQVENIRRVAARYRLSQMADGNDVLIAKPYFDLEPDETIILRNVPVPEEPIKPDELPEKDRGFVDQGGRMFWLRQIVNKMGAPVKELALKLSHYQPLPEYDDPNGCEWLLMKAIFRKWIGELTKPVLIVPIPLYHYIEETASPEAYQARFSELRELEAVTMFDPIADYMSISKSERRGFRFEKDIHPTPAHHRFLAESMAKPIRELIDKAAEYVTAI